MKWYGQIGFITEEETAVDVYDPVIIEKDYMGDLVKNYKNNETGSVINQNITLSNQLSIIFDPYLRQNFYKIAYITFEGAKWTVSNADIQPPRLLLTFGRLYSEDMTDEE